MDKYMNDYWRKEISRWKMCGYNFGFTNGVFDIIHSDHVRVLDFAKTQCDILIVGVNSDRSVKEIKGPDRPVRDEDDRLFVVRSLKSVDLAFLFDSISPSGMVKEIEPLILVKGPDWRNREMPKSAKYAEKYMVAPHKEKMHSTEIIQRMGGVN